MAKCTDEFYLKLSRELFTEKYKDLSNNAKWIFIVLNELEQQFGNDKTNDFYFSDKELARKCNLGLSTLKKAKAELLKTNLVKTWQAQVIQKDGRKSEKHFTHYRIMK